VVLNLIFHHVGFAVADLNQSVSVFEHLGYKSTGSFLDNVQNIKIETLEKIDSPIIELIEPNGEKNPVDRFLINFKAITYHVAYLTKSFEEDIKKLRKQGFSPTTRILNAVAFNNRRFIFLYNDNTGFIELLED